MIDRRRSVGAIGCHLLDIPAGGQARRDAADSDAGRKPSAGADRDAQPKIIEDRFTRRAPSQEATAGARPVRSSKTLPKPGASTTVGSRRATCKTQYSPPALTRNFCLVRRRPNKRRWLARKGRALTSYARATASLQPGNLEFPRLQEVSQFSDCVKDQASRFFPLRLLLFFRRVNLISVCFESVTALTLSEFVFEPCGKGFIISQASPRAPGLLSPAPFGLEGLAFRRHGPSGRSCRNTLRQPSRGVFATH